MKRAFLSLVAASGAFSLLRALNSRRLLIVTYHRFECPDEPAQVTARVFARHLEYLARHYTVLSLTDAAERLRRGEKLPPRPAVITIDDGYRDSYEVAFPVLRRYNLPATIFVVTGFLDRTTWLWTDKIRYATLTTKAKILSAEVGGQALHLPLDDRQSRIDAAHGVNTQLKKVNEAEREAAISRILGSLGVPLPLAPEGDFAPLSWDEVREMERAGVEIGSHTVTHPILTHLPVERLSSELSDSRARLEEQLGREVRLFCYPNGDYDETVRREVERAGYACSVTTEPGLNEISEPMLALKRIPGECDLLHLEQSTSGFEQLKNRLLAR